MESTWIFKEVTSSFFNGNSICNPEKNAYYPKKCDRFKNYFQEIGTLVAVWSHKQISEWCLASGSKNCKKNKTKILIRKPNNKK